MSYSYFTLGVKCSYKTKEILHKIFKEDRRFCNLKNCNPSWFFKFCAVYTMENLKEDDKFIQKAIDCHYVDFFNNSMLNSILS